MQKIYSAEEIAGVLLQLIDSEENPNKYDTGVIDREYIGQGIHKIYVQRDTLVRVTEMGEGTL